MNEQFWWYLARATGLVAWALSMASILWGTALATRVMGKRPPAPWLLDLHRYLGGLTVAFVGLHIGALVADSYLHFGWADVLVPWASAWKSTAVAWGVIAGWMLVIIEGTSLLMRRIPRRVWHGIHLTSYLVAVLSTAHLFTAGTDASHPAVRLAVAGTVLAMGFFLTYRQLDPRRTRSPRRSSPGVQALATK